MLRISPAECAERLNAASPLSGLSRVRGTDCRYNQYPRAKRIMLPPRLPPGPSENYRYGHSESNALIGIEFGEFRQKLKNSEKCINSNVWRSLGAIGIDSVSFEAFRSVSSFFIFFQFLSSGLEGPVGVVSWLRGMHRYGFLAWKR